MKSYESSARIDASPERVWAVLSDGAGWSGWESGVERVEGRIAERAKVKIFTEVSPGRAFPLTVTDFEPGRGMTFAGGMPLGLFRGVRRYTLTPVSDTQTEFTMREEYTGPLLPLIWKSMPDLQPSFDKFATGLKRRVEA
ncbi:MAG TPA: SRPBCC domain-containing protein [Actinophytocola sp.]|nr:SRPBCC domain-containing protein [Actinophytocola sp.]